MIARAALAAAVAAVVSLAAAACTTETIVLATVPVEDGGTGRHPSTRCATSADCTAGELCDKPSCDAAVGTCALFPSDCDGPADPVCGCDGISYFDDCLRRAAGVAASTPGACPFDAAELCGGSADVACPAGASCARLLGFQHGIDCPRDAPGVCWVVPATCPASTSTDRWDSCSGGSYCLGTCDAIRGGEIYKRAQQCP